MSAIVIRPVEVDRAAATPLTAFVFASGTSLGAMQAGIASR
jgi:hypothetical protein